MFIFFTKRHKIILLKQNSFVPLPNKQTNTQTNIQKTFKTQNTMAATKTVKEQVKEAFKTMPFTEAVNATIEQRRALLHIMSETRLNKMCMETSKYYGMYNMREIRFK